MINSYVSFTPFDIIESVSFSESEYLLLCKIFPYLEKDECLGEHQVNYRDLQYYARWSGDNWWISSYTSASQLAVHAIIISPADPDLIPRLEEFFNLP